MIDQMGAVVSEDGREIWRNNGGIVERRCLYNDHGWESVANCQETPTSADQLREFCESGGFGYEPPK